ncbi:hypothetical protein CBF34_09965 [Vagococcus penaei]|uniref:Uncharacterized protein n=1 Tax=Vagococcus penaei TaxID=633807 RepID=A0A1Q2D4I9_9ENTE|nr:YlbF family regulator [Vagococcus penaei]AQP53239.1 hypothetical protein BW732_02645 [Vagococcus penaei]RST98685.1 hypothetical protein CBF34_09965 [Vagococcus penaei]
MIVDDKLFKLEDEVLALKECLLDSSLVDDYVRHHEEIKASTDVEQLIQEFQEVKHRFESIESYGNYAPGFKETRRELRKKKRALDTHELVMTYKQSETALQNVLDYLALDLSKCVSEKIKVDAGNPFFEFASRGCGGSCHGKK